MFIVIYKSVLTLKQFSETLKYNKIILNFLKANKDNKEHF